MRRAPPSAWAPTRRSSSTGAIAPICRRDAFEADEAIEEGVKIKWLTTIKEIVGPDLTVEMMELDANGRPAADRASSKR